MTNSPKVPTLHEWSARRAGGYITINHSAGKLTSVVSIGFEGTMLVAKTSAGQCFILDIPVIG